VKVSSELRHDSHGVFFFARSRLKFDIVLRSKQGTFVLFLPFVLEEKQSRPASASYLHNADLSYTVLERLCIGTRTFRYTKQILLLSLYETNSAPSAVRNKFRSFRYTIQILLLSLYETNSAPSAVRNKFCSFRCTKQILLLPLYVWQIHAPLAQ
jgi:hypothetical protein